MSPEAVVKLRYPVLGILGGLLLGLLLLTPLTPLGASIDIIIGKVHILAKGDTPIVIAGGSIHALDYFDAGWVPVPHTTNVFEATLKHSGNNFVTFAGFPAPAPSDLDANSSWKIRITNKDPGHPRKEDAIVLCSRLDCAVGATPDALGIVYMKIRSTNARWYQVNAKNKVLHFHDTSNNCDPSTVADDTESSCDAIVDIVLHTPTNPGGLPPYTCTDGQCSITIGMTY
jgi:hypothetical protein